MLTKLRLNLEEQDLAYRFSVSQSTVSRVFRKWMYRMSEQLKFLIHCCNLSPFPSENRRQSTSCLITSIPTAAVGCSFPYSRPEIYRGLDVHLSRLLEIRDQWFHLWPFREYLCATMPMEFKHFVCILDCTEIFIERPYKQGLKHGVILTPQYNQSIGCHNTSRNYIIFI